MADRPRLSSLRLARRSLSHRRGQTLLIVLIAALISGTVVFAVGYQRQAQQAIVDATFAPDGPNSAWMLAGPPDADLTSVLPRGWEQLFDQPVAGRVVAATWVIDRFPLGIDGTLLWRADSCQHLVMVSGHCPSGPDEVAVSTADADRYGVRAGQRIQRRSTIGTPSWITISGLYRPRDPNEAYWFGNPPIGSSGFDSTDQPRSDPLITVRSLADGPGAQQTLDLRLDRAALRSDSLPELRQATTDLAAGALRAGARLTSSIPAALDRVAVEKSRLNTGLVLTLAQLAMLGAVVVILLASVALSAQRAELGLGRLRGESPVGLRRQAVGEWAAAVGVGWLLGWLPGLCALAFVARTLPGRHGVPVSAAMLVGPLLALIIMVGGIMPGARATLRQPVIDLLRAAPAVVRDGGRRQFVIDVAAVMVGLSGLLVAVQTGTSSILGLLAPSVAAIALGLLLIRATTGLAAAGRRRWSRRGGRPAALLGAIVVLRLRGLRLMIVTTALAAAFVAFAIQVQVIGADVRRHQAEVSTGAAAVLQVRGDPAALIDALDDLDPHHADRNATMTAVVVTRRADREATRGMFVEPGGFARVAYGADRAGGESAWSALAAPAIAPIDLTGDAVIMSIGAHGALGGAADGDEAPPAGGSAGGTAEVGIDYLGPDGERHSATLGRIRLVAQGPQRLRQAVSCARGCRLLRLSVAPSGPMRGPLPLLGFGTEASGQPHDVDLGPAAHWQPVPTPSPDAQVQAEDAAQGLLLSVSSGGGRVALQQGWAPAVLPVMLSADVRPEVDPTVAAPDGSPLPIRPVVVAGDAVPGQLQGVAVGDLAAVLRAGSGPTAPETSVQVWLSASAADRLPQVVEVLTAKDLPVSRTTMLQPALDAQRLSASALAGSIAPGLAALAGVFAALGILLTMANQRALLARDLAALRLAGLRRRSLRDAVAAAYLGSALLAVLVGTAAGAVGCALVIADLPLVPDASSAIRADLDLHAAALVVCAVASAAVAAAVILPGVRRASAGRIDELRVQR